MSGLVSSDPPARSGGRAVGAVGDRRQYYLPRAATVQAVLVDTGMLRMPYMISLGFLIVVIAMSYELTRDVGGTRSSPKSCGPAGPAARERATHGVGDQRGRAWVVDLGPRRRRERIFEA